MYQILLHSALGLHPWASCNKYIHPLRPCNSYYILKSIPAEQVGGLTPAHPII